MKHTMNPGGVGWMAALAVTIAPALAWGQDCQVDADCGQGFQCIHDSAGTSSVTGVGGSSVPECGDAICEGGSEDIETCPEDCDTIQYCAPAECTSDSDCAEGYECGPEAGSSSAVSGAGGSSGSVCGDGICAIDETSTSCATDCESYRLCQVVQVECTTNADCPAGYYCYFEESSSSVAVGFASASTDGTDGSSVATSGAVDSASGDVGTTTSAPPQDTTSTTGSVDSTGVCLAETTDDVSAVSTGTSDVATVGGESAASGTTGSVGAGGVSATAAVGGDAVESASSDGASEATSASAATGSGGSGDPDGSGGGDDGDDGGCSCTLLGSNSGTSALAMLLLGLVAGVTRRRRASRP